MATKKPKLTYQQIQTLLNSAKSLGLPKVSVDGLRESLVAQSFDLTQAQRLNIELIQAPKATREIVKAFDSGFQSVSASVMERGKTELMAISDEEWDKLVNGATNEQ